MSQIDDFLDGKTAQPQQKSEIDAFLDGAPEPGIAARLKQGASRAYDSARTALTDDPNQIAQIAAEQARTALPQTETQRKMAEEIAPYSEAASKAEGVVDNVKAWGALGFKRAGQLISNPAEAGKMIAEQLPNSLPGIAGGFAGAKAGAALGSFAGPVGTAVGGIGGAILGGFAGGYGLEKGAAVQEQVQKQAQERGIDVRNEAEVSKMLQQSYPEIEAAAQRKGLGTAGTDAVLNAATMGLAGVGGRTLAKEASALAKGVKAGTVSAADAATELARLEAINAARNTLKARALRGTGVVSAEMAGEGISEAAGQKLAYGEVNPGEVVDEALLGLGSGGAMALGSKAFNKAAGVVDQDAATRDLAAARDGLPGLGPNFTTTPGAADPNAPVPPGAAPVEAPEAPDLTTSPGAGVARDGMDFTREVDTSGLSLQDPAELERARAATVDYQPGDTTPQWDTQPGAAPVRSGLDMPAPDFDTGALGFDPRPLSERMGLVPAANTPLTKAAALSVDTGASPVQFLGATGRDVQLRQTGPGVTNESNVIDVDAREVLDQRGIPTARRLTNEQEGGARATSSQPLALPAPTNLREGLERIRAQRQEAARLAQVPPTQGANLVPQAPQAIKASPQPAQAAAARAGQAAPVAAPNTGEAQAQTGIRRGSQSPTNQTPQESAKYDRWMQVIDSIEDGAVYTDPISGDTYTARVTEQGIDKRGKQRGKSVSLLDGNGVPAFDLASNGEAGKDAGYFGASIEGLNGPAWTFETKGNAERDGKAEPVGAQAASAAGTQAQAPQTAVARPDGWRKSMLRAAPIARAMGIDPKGKRLAQVVAEIDARDTQTPTTPAPQPAPGPVRLGRDNRPLSEGGKPFKTRNAAGDAKKLQPMMRVVTVPGGYALAEKTPAQLAAEERASRRLRNPNTSARGEPIPAHAFIAAAGGLNRVAASDMGVDGNPRIGNRTLFAGQGRGLSMDQATQMLIQDGYLSEGATINDALALIKTSLTRPQYNADGIERIAQAEADAQFEDYLAAQEEAAAEGDADPFGMADEFTAEELDEVGYTSADPALQAEVNALIAQADAIGIDTYAILDDIARTYANATQDQYNAAARDALTQAIARSNQDGGSVAAQAAPAAEPAAEQGLNQPDAPANQAQVATESVAPEALELTALSPAQAAAQQDAQEQAAKAEAAAKRAEDAAAKAEEDRKRIAQASVRAADRFEMGQDPLDSLTGQGSIFDDAPAQSAPTAASDDEGRERFTLSIEMFGDVPYRASKPVDAGNGDVVSSRVITTKTKLTAANAQSLGLPKDKGTVYAWRVSVIRRADGAAHSVIEAMATDNGRSPDGEVLAHFKEVENPEAMERIAPAIANAALSDWRAAQPQQAPTTTEAVAQPITRADVTAAQQQAATLIAERIDAMTAGEVNTIAKRFLPTMGVTPTVSKERNKAAVTDFTKVNPMAAAAEFGATLPADVRRALDAEFEGRAVDAPPAFTYINGDRAEYTGNTETISGGLFYEVRFTEGAKNGKTAVTQRAPDGANPGQRGPVKPTGIVTPQLSGNPEQFIKIAADSIKALRKVDVDRVLTETPAAFRQEVAAYISEQRKDLADEVDEVMADLIREVEQASVARKAAEIEPETPKLTQAEAKSLMEWQDLGQKDGVKTHALTFYESQADKDAKRGRMIVARVTKEVDGRNWMVEGTEEMLAVLGMAKKKAEQVGMARVVADGYVAEDNPFAEYDAVAKQYGYEVRPDGMIGSDGKFPGPKMAVQRGRLRVESGSGDLLASYAGTSPDGLGKFLESFWYAEKKADGFVEQAAAESDYASTAKQVEAAQELLLPIRQGEMITDDVRQTLESLLKIPSLKGFDQPTARRLLMIAGATKAAIEKVMRTNPVSIDDLATELGKATGEAEKKKAFDRAFNAASQIAQTDPKVKELLDIYNVEKSILDGIASERGLYGVKWAERNVSSRWTGQSQKVRSVKQRLVDAVNKAAPSGVRQSDASAAQNSAKPIEDAGDKLAGTIKTKETDKDGPMFSRTGAQSPNAQQPTTRAWYDRFVSLLPASYRNDSHRREPLPAEDWNVQRSAEVREKIDALNKQLRGANDRKGYGPVSVDGLGNLQVDARSVSAADLSGPIRALADELGAGVAATNVRSSDVRALMDVGFVSETSLAAIADRLMGRPFAQPVNTYTKDSAPGTILTYKPRGFPAALFARSATPPADSNERNVATQLLVDGLKAKWTRAPEIIVARNMQDPQVPQAVRDYDETLKSQGATGEARGFIYKGKVYLLSDELKGPQQIAEVLFHEVLGHYGLRGAFGDSLDAILQQIGTMRRRDVVAKAREYGLFDKDALGGLDKKTASDAQIWAAMSAKDRLSAAEEVLAEMAQTQPNIGFVTRAIAAIRNWLRANVPGFNKLALSDADIVQAYLLPARGFVTRSSETPQQAIDRAMTAFSRETSEAPVDLSSDPRFHELFYGEPTQQQVAEFQRWLDANPETIVRLYHGTAAVNPVEVKGLLKTTASRRNSMQSTSGYVYLSVYPGMADSFARMAALNRGAGPQGKKHARYAVDMRVAELLPDTDQLRNQRMFADRKVGNTLAESLVYGHAARVRGDVASERISLDGPMFSRTPGDQTQTDAFKRWFKDSKVVDAQTGKPLVVYHGTTSEFNTFRVGNAPGWGRGIYFTNNESVARDEYAGDDGRVVAAYVSLQNPYTGQHITEAQMEATEAGKKVLADGGNVIDASNDDGRFFGSMLRELGYDGVMLKGSNNIDGYEIVAFRPEQIKSATGNNGNFDPANPDIRFSRTTDTKAAIGTPAATIRAAITKAYGKLLGQLESKGLVTLTQTQEQAIEAAAQARAAKTGGDVEAIKRSMINAMQGETDLDVKRSANGAIQGFFDPQTGQSFLIADNLTAEAAPGVMMHEVGIHMAADGSMKALFNRAAMMLKLQRGNPFMKAVQDRMDAAGETSGEEAAAYIAEAYENDRANAPASVQRWLADLLAAVKAWMFKKGIMGADRLTVADIAAVARANARSMARDGGATGGQGFGPAFSHAPAGDQTQTDAFKRWFKDSKVVDAQTGKPLRVYHGSSRDIEIFAAGADEAGQSNGNRTGAWGSYFTPSAAEASIYAEIAGGDSPQNVVPVYLAIRNPYVMNRAEWGKHSQRTAKAATSAEGRADAKAVRAGIEALGHDGIVIRDRGFNDEWVAFRPEQIKSAISNNGDFDPSNPDIRFSRAGVSNTGGQAATGWDAPTPTGFDDVIYKLQDKNIDLKRVVEAITKSVGQVSDSINAYLKEELFHKRAAKRVADFGDRELKPLMNKMRLAGLSMEDVEEYLHARHAKEANAVIAQRNPGNAGLQDGGSGMTNAAADNYFAKLDPTQRRKLEAVAKSVDAIIEGTRKLYVDYGLEDQAVVDGWANMYQHYIPLMREDKDGGMGTGQGFSVKGKETKGRTGSTRKVVDILANVAMQREKLIVRGEKNIVAQALVGLAQANPNPDFWEVRSQAPTERVFDPKTGVVVDRPDPLFKSRENVAVAKVKDANGKVTEQMVVFNEDNPRAVRMAAAMKNLDAGNLEGLLGVSAKITRYFAAINTQYNPVFGVVNLVRDVQGAMVNLGTTPLAGQQGKIAKDTLSALRGIYGDIRKTRRGGQATSQWSQLWEQMQDDGGTTGYRDLFQTSADRAENLKSILNPEGWMDSKWGKFFTADGRLKVPMGMAQKGASELFGWLSDYNEAMENGVRLAAYKAALDKGMSREQAASLAKNLTVNFNRKGQAGMQAGAVYAFFNAAMQGTARIGQTLFDMDGGDVTTLRLSKTGKAVVYGGVMLGVMQALALSAAGFDDDDPPEFVRERSLIIPTGGKTYVSIPMPLGLHVIPGIGRHATEFALSGFDKPAKRAVSMVGMFADAFNPIGNAGLSMQTIAPTALDPLVALAENKDWTGKPIARVSSNKAMPGHTQWKDAATGFSKVVAEAINWISGGNEYVAGAFSPTPDQIDYLLAQVGGGVAREAAKVQQTISTAMSGETLPTHKIPLVGRFVGNAASQASQGSAFYANLNKLNELETEIKGLRKDGRFDEAAKLVRENPQATMIAMANRAERDVQKLRRDKRELIAKDASREEVRAKEEQITAVMMRLNEAAERRKAN